jgi:hypothetical protein
MGVRLTLLKLNLRNTTEVDSAAEAFVGSGWKLSIRRRNVELVVDAAGKVRSAKVIKATDVPLIQATAVWHFIPAFRDGTPVACRIRLSIWALK